MQQEVTLRVQLDETLLDKLCGFVDALSALAAATGSVKVQEMRVAPVDTERTPEKPAEAVKQTKPQQENTPEITLEVVRAKLAALNQAGKQKEVKALITTGFGVRKLTDIPAERYAEVLEQAKQLEKELE
jgi:hypothetical protein